MITEDKDIQIFCIIDGFNKNFNPKPVIRAPN